MGTILIVVNCERCGAPNPGYLDEDANEVICEQCARLTDPDYFTARRGAPTTSAPVPADGNTGPTNPQGSWAG